MFSSLLLSCSSTIDSWKNRGAHRIGASISQHWASGTIRCFSTLCYSGYIEHGSLCQVQTKLHTRIPVWLKGIKWQTACRVPGECGAGVALWSRTIFFHILKRGLEWPRAWELELPWFSTISCSYREVLYRYPDFPLNLCHSRCWENPQKQAEKCWLGLPWSWWWWMQTCCPLSLGCQWGSPSWWTFSSWKWSCHHPHLLYFHWHCVPSCVRTYVVTRSDRHHLSHCVSFSFAKQHRWLGIAGG